MTRILWPVCLLGALLSTGAMAQNYVGYLDMADCNIIAGWAEDANNPGGSINVDIFDGQTYVTTTAANLYRSDVGVDPTAKRRPSPTTAISGLALRLLPSARKPPSLTTTPNRPR